MQEQHSEGLPSRLVSAFLRFSRTPWHNVPADGLTLAETIILENIGRANKKGTRLRISDLSAILRLTTPTVTQHLNSLESQGFVEKTPSASDKRAINLSLTEKGMESLRSHKAKLERDFEKFIEFIGEENAETMADLLTKAQTYFRQNTKLYEHNDI